MFKTISSKIIYENPWIRLYEDLVEFPDGHRGIYAYVERLDAGVVVIAVDEKGRLGIIKEYRYPVRKDTYGFVQGGKNKGESELDCGQKELEEEGGYVAKHWERIGSLHIDVGFNSQETPVYVATGLIKTKVKAENSELIHGIDFLHLGEIEDMIERGEIKSGWLLAGLSIYKAYASKKILL